MVDRHLALRVVVHRALEEEAQEALRAIAALAGSEVGEQHKVEQQRSGQNRVAAKEVNLDLHGVAHPAKDVDVVPTLFVIVAGRIIVDAHLVVIVAVKVGLLVGLEYALERRKLRHLLGVEVGRLVEHKAVAVAKNVG